MNKLNLDTSSRMNIECKAQDSFELNLEVKNQDESDYIFSVDDHYEKEMVIFSVVDFEGEPVMVCVSDKNINWLPDVSYNTDGNVVTNNLPEYISVGSETDYPNYVNSGDIQGFYKSILEVGRARSIALSNAINTTKKFVVGALDKGGYKDVPKDFFVVTHNRKQDVLINNASYTYKILEPCITVEDGLISINIQSKYFKLPEGKYSYDIKIVSSLINSANYDLTVGNHDLQTDYSIATGTIANTNTSNFFSNIKTWMQGSLIVKK